MKHTLITLLILLSSISYSQIGKVEIDYFRQGIAAFENADYQAADSLFYHEYRYGSNSKALYNLAVTKIMLEEYCEGCRYLMIADYSGDEDAEEIFKQICIKSIDSTYLDKKFSVLPDKNKHKYLVEEIHYECDSTISGLIHKKNHSNTVRPSGNVFVPRRVDIYAAYFIEDSLKYYYFNYGSTFDEDNEMILDNFISWAEKHLSEKYDFNSVPNSEAYMSLKYFVGRQGEIFDVSVNNFPYEFIDDEIESELISEIESVFQKIKGIRPEKCLGESVISRQGVVFDLLKK